MDGYRRLMPLLVASGLFCVCGSQCPAWLSGYQQPPVPQLLPPSPTQAQVIEVVNRTSGQICNGSTVQGKLSGPGFISLQANLAFERPRRFRLRADSPFGAEVDLGSNDEMFWFWIRRNQPPAVYYCRHDQFANSPMRQVVPIDPQWIMESLGAVSFDPGLQHEGPIALPDNRLEMRTYRNTPEGRTTKVAILDASSGWVLEQRQYDAQNRLVASSKASRHRRDPYSGLTMPQVVDIEYPMAQFSMRLDLGDMQINRLQGNPAELWALPCYDGSPAVNLCGPQPQIAPQSPMAPQSPLAPQGGPMAPQGPPRLGMRTSQPQAAWQRR